MMLRVPFRLKSKVGRNYSVDPDDTSRTKKTLRELGYYETPSYGMTPYSDEPMFRGIEDLQDDFDLFRDGIMNPAGETVAKLNEVLDHKVRISKVLERGLGVANPSLTTQHRSGKKQDQLGKGREEDRGNQQIALGPAFPIIAYEIAVLFGMTVAAAYAWWISLSIEEKKRVRAQIKDAQERGRVDDPNDDECEKLLKIDIDTCRQITKNRGKQAGARCYASANERYAACRAGKPRDQWPPLDTWNN